MKNKGLFFIILSTLYPLPSTLLFSQPTGAQFLKIPVGARAVSLGSALAALVDDPTALYWNPAGLNSTKNFDLLATHNIWLAQTNESFAGFSFKISTAIVAGASFLQFNSGTMEKRDATGKLTGSFESQDRALAVGGSYQLRSGLVIGAVFKSISQEIDRVTAKGTALDVGVILRPVSRVSLGGSISNIGAPMKFVNESYQLPRTARAGLGLGVMPNLNFVAAITQDLAKTNKEPDVGFGLEYNLTSLNRNYFWAPVVWRLGYILPQGPGMGIPGAGIGLRILGSELDYAISPMEDLGFTHRVSFRVSFGRIRTDTPKVSVPEAKKQIEQKHAPILIGDK